MSPESKQKSREQKQTPGAKLESKNKTIKITVEGGGYTLVVLGGWSEKWRRPPQLGPIG